MMQPPQNGFSYEFLGTAKQYAQIAANRDGCKWHIDKSVNTTGHYVIRDEFTENPYPISCKTIAWVKPQVVQNPPEAVILSQEEKALVAAVLSPDEPGRDYYPGSEKTKVSLWKKLTGGK